VLIDETWVKTNMTRLRGWAPRGERLVDKIPHGHWKTATLLAALRHDRIEAPCLLDGPINGERFRAYVEQFLVPTLKPRDVVILDNLGSHKGKAVRAAIRAAGAHLLFLPKYSPDLEPYRTGLRQAQDSEPKGRSQNLDALCKAAAETLARYAPDECAEYLKNAGYAMPIAERLSYDFSRSSGKKEPLRAGGGPLPAGRVGS
jgi:putative transposase